jgi:hypothetical protein
VEFFGNNHQKAEKLIANFVITNINKINEYLSNKTKKRK